MKKCPACVEEVKDEAIKCKHCGEKFSSPAEPIVTVIITIIILIIMFAFWSSVADHAPKYTNYEPLFKDTDKLMKAMNVEEAKKFLKNNE